MPSLLRRLTQPFRGQLLAADGETVTKAQASPAPPVPIGDIAARRAALAGRATGGGIGGSIPPDMAAAMEAQGFDPTQSFSPGDPIQPWYGYSRTPRAWDLPTGWNITARPRSSVSRASFDTLRVLTSGAYDVARICIDHRIDALRSYDWRVTPAEGEDSNVDDAVTAARRALRRPDGRNRFAPWMAMLLENVLRYDAPALYRRRNRAGAVIGLEVIDGTTIAPLLDYYGRRPASPAPAYVQYVNGLPWDWLTDRDLIYEPFRPQPDSPYGIAPIESVIVAANSDMRLAQHLLEVYTEGSIPGAIAEAPQDLTNPEQVQDFQDAFNAWLEGDQTQKVKVRFVPHGTNFNRLRENRFDEPLGLWFTRKTCAAFCVMPQTIGLTQDVNRANAEAQSDIGEQVGDLPLAQHIEGIVTSYLQDDLGLPVEFHFDLGRDKEDRLDEANVWKIGVQLGAVGTDEMRDEFYGLPTDPERPVPRYIDSTRLGPIPLDSLYRVAGPVDTETQAPSEDVPLPTAPYKGVEGIMPVKMPGGQQFHMAPEDPDEPERPELEHVVPGTDTVGATTPPSAPAAPDAFAKPVAKSRVRKDDNKAVVAAGLVVRAADTGRVLMLQRSIADDTDPAAGTWEFPGGHIDPGETPFETAWREWQEETGCPLPAGGALAGFWTAGCYQGFVWSVSEEFPVAAGDRVANPDDPDGDDIEACAWWEPADAETNPALRPECRLADWELIAAAPVAKEQTAGVTAATGIVGVNLHGRPPHDDDENDDSGDDEEVRKELRRWRDQSRQRVRNGRPPRRFDSNILPNSLADTIWSRLAAATTRDTVDQAFTAVTKAADRPKGEAHPGHAYDMAIADAYTPKLVEALKHAVTGIPAAAAAAAAGGTEDTAVAAEAAAEAAVAAHITIDTTQLLDIIRQLYGDAALAGAHIAATQPGGAATVTTTLTETAANIDWGNWTPGHPAAAALTENGGIADLLDQADITVQGIADTTLTRLGNILAGSLRQGLDVNATGRALQAVIADPDRAQMIAHTETARAMSAASMNTYRAAGTPGKRWLVYDPCDICADNEAAGVIPIGDDFPSGDDAPPAHPRCLVGSTRIVVPGNEPVRLPTGNAMVSSGDGRAATASTAAVAARDFGRRNVWAATDRHYIGEVVSIVLASGHELTGTPNHPIATPTGWVALSELEVGDDVLHSTSPEWEAPTVDPDVDDVPPTIQEIAESFGVVLGPMPTAAEDFHGDGAGSDVHVVLADGLLLDDTDTSRPKHRSETSFGLRNVGQLGFDSDGPSAEILLGHLGSPDGSVSGGSIALSDLCGGLGHAEKHRLASPPRGDTLTQEPHPDNRSADTEGFCERLLTLSPDIAASQITVVKRDVVSTHVYNLDSAEGWYIGNGIVTHNCRCSVAPATLPD